MAVAIIALTATALIYSFNYGFFVMRLVRENQRATQIILERAETVRLFNWNQVIGTQTSQKLLTGTFTDKVYDPQAPIGQQGITYTTLVEVASVPFNNAYSDNLRKINISLTWSGAGGIPRSRSFFTLVAKDGQQNYLY